MTGHLLTSCHVHRIQKFVRASSKKAQKSSIALASTAVACRILLPLPEFRRDRFYNYFESKDAFAAAILDEYWRAIESNYVSILEDDFVSPLKRVERHFSELIEYHERQKFTFGCLIGNLALELAAQSSIARSKLKALLRTWTAALAKCLSAASEAGELPLAREPQDLAATLIEAFEGAVMVAKVEQSGRALRRFGTVALPRLLA